MHRLQVEFRARPNVSVIYGNSFAGSHFVALQSHKMSYWKEMRVSLFRVGVAEVLWTPFMKVRPSVVLEVS